MEPTNFRNCILITMFNMLDLVDKQREHHPNVNKFSYSLKALNLKSRIDFLLAKELKKYVSKVDIQTSLA